MNAHVDGKAAALDGLRKTLADRQAAYNALGESGAGDRLKGEIFATRAAIRAAEGAAALTAEDVLREFVADVNSTRGLTRSPRTGFIVPFAADDWSDLAITYLRACVVLGLCPDDAAAPGRARETTPGAGGGAA